MFILISSLEILAINLYHTHILSKKKYSNRCVFFVLLLLTALILLLMYVLKVEPEGSVRSVLIGGLYIIPIYMLYDMSLKKLFTIMVYCWTYTLSVHTLAYGLMNILNVDQSVLYTIILQTIIILATFFFIVNFSKVKFTVILEKANKTNQNLLLIFGVAIFSLIIFLRYYLLPNNYIYLVLLILVMTIAITSYTLMFTIVESNSNLVKVNSMAFKDQLTGINNRYALYKDIDQWLIKNQTFSVIFIDLNNLKGINDKYSHQVGDQYIKQFSKAIKDHYKNQGEVYRFAGDEFVVLTYVSLNDLDFKHLKKDIKKEMAECVEYHGFSIGVARFPDDGMHADVLIHHADQRMYLEKNKL